MFTLTLALAGPDLSAIVEALRAAGVVPVAPPSMLRVDDEVLSSDSHWPDRIASSDWEVLARWDDGSWCLIAPGTIVKAERPGFAGTAESVAALLSAVPFTVASFRTLHLAWADAEGDYRAPGFGDLHWPHGWACAFRGAGHNRLVSRRWLDHGPWRVLRAPHDTTLVQFHDLEADADRALEQAKPGHALMGFAETGGYIVEDYIFTHDLSGEYEPATRTLKLLVFGREVSQGELLDACAARANQVLGPDQPIDAVAYVFAEPEAARAHLHELWLRELQCWTYEDGREVRLDDTYKPQG